MNGAPILVTGATGFLGRQLVAMLLERGAAVRALVRDATDASSLGAAGVELARGDIGDEQALRRATDGCGAVFHLAGIVSHERKRWEELRRVNVGGTRRLLSAVDPATRVVHVSSVAAVGPAPSRERPADETQPFPTAATRLPYAATKREAEQVALDAAAAGANVVVANPAFLIGPGDARGVSTWPILEYLRGRLRVSTSGGLSFVDVRDVAAGLVALLEHGRAGERTILGSSSGNLGWDEFFARVALLGGVRRRMVNLPPRLAVAGATIVRKPVSPDEVRAAAHWWFYDAAKAERELGLRCRPVDEAIADTIRDRRH